MTTKISTKIISYYPGCSSQASGAHLDISLKAVMPKLGVELKEVRDWNCCGASVGHIAGGHTPVAALSGRNLANAKEDGTTDFVTPCAACYLNSHYTNEKIINDEHVRNDVNEALGAVGKSYDGSLKVRHICEVIAQDVGMDAVKAQVKNSLGGLKVAGYIGCQTVRPFAATERGGKWETYDEPHFLNDFISATGATAVPYKKKTSCCGGSVSVMSPDKTLHLIRDIVQEAADNGADVIATPCPLCQTNVEMYQGMINEKFGTHFNIPVVFYSQLFAVAFGMDPNKDASLDKHLIAPEVVAARAK
jgi:heterodisulfide reductase subunit B